MAFKSAIWQPVAIALSAVNLVAVGFAAGAAEPWHAAVHAGLAVVFGLGAQRLRLRPRAIEGDTRLDELEIEVNNLRGDLGEVQERLDFTERVLAQERDLRRLGPEGQP
jgi:hypothetical protein